MGGKEMFAKMLDSVFQMAPVYDENYYRGVIHEIREMQIMSMGQILCCECELKWKDLGQKLD